MCAMAMNVGVGLGLAMGVDRKKAEACGGEEPKDARWGERGLSDPFNESSWQVQDGFPGVFVGHFACDTNLGL